MTKRRKFWWFVGGTLGATTFLVLIALLIQRNGPDAKLERALDQIIAENGFEFRSNMISYIGGRADSAVVSNIYQGDPIDKETAKEVIAQLREVCPNCTVEVITFNEDIRPVTAPTGEHTFEMKTWFPPKDSGVYSISLVFDDNALYGDSDSSSSNLSIQRRSRSGFWSFLRNLWPL